MDSELIFAYLPIVVALYVFFQSSVLLKSKTTKLGVILFIVITILNISATYLLINMYFFKAWPTYIPHIAIGVSTLLLLIQFLFSKRN